MNRIDVVHAMNSAYGQRNLYGARSAYIARATPPNITLLAYCRKVEPHVYRPNNVRITQIALPLLYRARRSLLGITLSRPAKRRASWRGFDAMTTRNLVKLNPNTIKIFHSWEWLPKTYETIRHRHPDAIIVRDVKIGRRFDYPSGEDIMTEADFVNYFLSPSDFITKSLCGWGIPDSKIIKVPFGVDTHLFKPTTSKPKRPVRFAFTGKLCDRKGIPRLLRVWKRLGLREAELHLYGIVAPEVQARLGDVVGVHTYGFIDITNELPKSHVFVFPSSLEGSSKSVFEALACGLPVITTPNSGSVVRNGREGYIVEPEDEEALGDAIKTLYQNPRLRAEMSKNARHQAEKFTWNAYADRIWSIYRSFPSL